MSCAICEIRKEKRFCPAVHGRICPQCCGEQREVTLDCPSDCPYLQQAREHEKPRSADQIDPAALFLQIEVSDQFMYEKEHLLMGLTFALAKAARADRSLHDQDLIAALSMLAKSYERRVNSGLHYEQPLTSDSQRRAAIEVETMVQGVSRSRAETHWLLYFADSEVLKALVFLVRLAHGRTSGRPKSRAFVDFLFAQFPEKESAVRSRRKKQAAGSFFLNTVESLVAGRRPFSPRSRSVSAARRTVCPTAVLAEIGTVFFNNGMPDVRARSPPAVPGRNGAAPSLDEEWSAQGYSTTWSPNSRISISIVRGPFF